MTESQIETPPCAPLQVTYVDDPRVVAESATEDYARHVVPLTARSNRWSLAMAMSALVSALFYLYIGASITQAVGSTNAIIGMVVTVVIFSLTGFAMSTYASRNGLTVALLSRRIFGSVGAVISALIFAVTSIYYCLFEGSIIAVALHQYIAPGSDIRIWYLIVVLYALPLVVGGVQKWLGKLNGVLLPFYVFGLIALVIAAGSKHGFTGDFLSIPAPDETSIPGWLWAVCINLGVIINMMVTVDFARFGKPEDKKFHGIVSFGPVLYILVFLANGLAGMFLMVAVFPGMEASEQGIVEAILNIGGFFGLIFVVISQTRINSTNYYVASTNLDAFFGRIFGLRWPRIVWVGVVGVIVFLLMLTNVFSYLLSALAWQGVLVTAWVAVVLVHMFIHRKDSGAQEFRPGRIRPVLAGTPAVIVSSVMGIAIYEFGADGSWYVLTAPLLTLLLAGIGYAVGVRMMGPAIRERAFDPHNEVEDVWAARILCHVCDRSYTAVEMDRDPSADQKAICAQCADGNRAFLHAAKVESDRVTAAHTA